MDYPQLNSLFISTRFQEILTMIDGWLELIETEQDEYIAPDAQPGR